MKYFISKISRAFNALFFLMLLLSPSISQSASVTDLLISEVMANPEAVSDSNGEWFELFNPTSEAIDLNGVTLSDLGSNSHLVSFGGSLLINPGDYFVLARSDDMSLNGGVNADYAYGSDFSLTNTEDEIILTDSLGNQLQLSFVSGFVQPGVSRELTGPGMSPAHFNLATASYGSGDLGTPGYGQYNLGSPTSPVPLPGSLWLMASGLLGLTGLKRRRH